MDDYGDVCRGKVAELEAQLAQAEKAIRFEHDRYIAADEQRTIAARCEQFERQRAEKAEAALPPAGILSDIRTITATYAFIGTSGVSFAQAVRAGERVQAWLATLPTPEAQP